MKGFEILEERLDNWARWARNDTHLKYSGMYNVLAARNLYAGERGLDQPQKPVNVLDALAMEKEINKLSTMNRRMVITMWITCPFSNIGRIAKVAGVRRKSIDERYREALVELKRNIEAKRAVVADFSERLYK